MTLVHHAVFATAVAAILGAAWRLASLAAPSGLARVLATAAYAAAAMVLEELVLGLVGAGGSAWAGAVAAVVTWASARWGLPRPEVGPGRELSSWWAGLGPGARAGIGAVLGALVVIAGAALRRPAIGLDNSVYHYLEVVAWVHDGHPGSIEQLGYDIPFGNYPVTNEVLLTWGAALARSFAPMALWGIAAYVLLGLAVWAAARTLDVPRPAAAAITAVVLGLPYVARHVNEPQTDVPVLVWSVSAAALVLGARRRPALLVPAIVAAGLAVGTKTTPLVPLTAVLAIGVWGSRASLRSIRVPLALAAAAGLAVSMPWYARNLVQHGSPFWPFQTTPFGDPAPAFLELVRTRFVERPVATLSEDPSRLVDALTGGLVVMLGALMAPLLSWRRAVLVATGLFAVTLLTWMTAFGTGLPRDPRIFAPFGWPSSTTRYLYPGIVVAALALGLAARTPGTRGRVATGLLLGAAAWSWFDDIFSFGAPSLPAPGLLAVGAALGTIVALAGRGVTESTAAAAMRRRGVGAAAAISAVVAAAVGAAVVGQHYTERHARTRSSTAMGNRIPARSAAGGVSLLDWFQRQPDWLRGADSIRFASRFPVATLAGDRLRHRVELLPARADCGDMLRRARGGWVVTSDPGFGFGFFGTNPYDGADCFKRETPVYVSDEYVVYRLEASPGASTSRSRPAARLR